MLSIILAVSALALPVAYRNWSGDILAFWYWALNINFTDSDIWFNNDPIALGGAILETIVIGIAIILLFVARKEIKTESKPVVFLRKVLLIAGILLLIAPAGYMIGAVFYDDQFYEKYTLFLGIYFAFGAAALSIIKALKCKK